MNVILCLQARCTFTQVLGALWAHKRGDGGPSMPLRAFAIASLILGAGVCVVGGVLHESGIREVRVLS